MTDQIKRARQLGRNMTDAEKILWSHLRNRQLANLKFRRQVPLGPFFVDFLCVEQKLIVEVDGGQHSEEADRSRTAWIEARGYRLIRFWNHDVLDNVTGCWRQLQRSRPPHPNCARTCRFKLRYPSPLGEGYDACELAC